MFTKALGVDRFERLIKKLGVINIFASNIEHLEGVSQNQSARALLLKGGGVKVDGLIDTGSARGPSSNIVCTEHQSKVNVVDTGCLSKMEDPCSEIDEARTSGSMTTSDKWASSEFLEENESMPRHELFIHNLVEFIPCGLGS